MARTGKPIIVNDASRSPNFHKMIDDTTGFATRSLICAPLATHHKILGVIEVLNKQDGSEFGEQDLEAVVSVANTAAMAIENTRLHQSVLEAYTGTIRALAAAIDAKDPYTRGHSQRVMEYSLLTGNYLSIDREDMETLEYAAVLHDVGKLAIESRILNKAAAPWTMRNGTLCARTRSSGPTSCAPCRSWKRPASWCSATTRGSTARATPTG